MINQPVRDASTKLDIVDGERCPVPVRYDEKHVPRKRVNIGPYHYYLLVNEAMNEV
jgi:hypothetical protein